LYYLFCLIQLWKHTQQRQRETDDRVTPSTQRETETKRRRDLAEVQRESRWEEQNAKKGCRIVGF